MSTNSYTVSLENNKLFNRTTIGISLGVKFLSALLWYKLGSKEPAKGK